MSIDRGCHESNFQTDLGPKKQVHCSASNWHITRNHRHKLAVKNFSQSPLNAYTIKSTHHIYGVFSPTVPAIAAVA